MAITVKSKARGNGEGTVYKRQVTRKDGSTFERWEGKVTVGYDALRKRRRKTVYGKTEQEVIGKVLELRQKVSTGTYFEAKLTISAFLNRFLKERKRQVKPSTFDEYTRCVEKRINPRIGGMKVEHVKPLHVQSLITDIAEASGAPTANKCRVVLYSAFKQAVRWELVTRNPVEAVDPLPTKARPLKLWGPEEAARFLDHASSHRLYALFYLGMVTGLRRGELLALQWSDLSNNSLSIVRSLVMVAGKLTLTTPKTSKGERRVPLATDVLEVLELHRERQAHERATAKRSWPELNYIFLSLTGTLLRPDNLRRLRLDIIASTRNAWLEEAQQSNDNATVKALESGKLLPDIRLHDFRHLHATMLIRAGIDPRAVADRLAHGRASFTLDRYAHVFEEQRADMALSLTALLRPDSSRSN